MDYLQHVYCSLLGYGHEAVCSRTASRKIVIFGNVLLDHTINLVNNETLVDKYELPNSPKAEVDSQTLTQLTADLCAQVPCTVNPGGSGLNTTRILRQLGTQATFMGAVGEDETAVKLREVLQQQDIDARLQIVQQQPTGQCVCLLRSQGESWYANIGASQYFSTDFLKQAEQDEAHHFLRHIERKQIIYIEGFFLTKREHVCDYILKNYIRERRYLAINLSAPYIVQQYHAELLQLAQSAFFIFGNEEEFNSFAAALNYASIEKLAEMLISNSKTPKVIAVTKGALGVEIISNYATDSITYQSFKAPRVQQVVDTTGAGDAFVAGFLQAWLEKRQLSECVRMATDIAAKVVTQIGAQLPST